MMTNLKSVLNGKLSLGSLGGLDLGRGVDRNVISSVRHLADRSEQSQTELSQPTFISVLLVI